MIEYPVAPTTRCILISFYDWYALDSRITSILVLILDLPILYAYLRIYLHIYICVRV